MRPDDVLAGLRSISGLEAVAASFHERLAQGPLDPETGTVGDPLAPNRDTVRPVVTASVDARPVTADGPTDRPIDD